MNPQPPAAAELGEMLVERLRSSAKAFREHPVYDSEGDGFYLSVQADEMDEAATTIAALRAEVEEGRALLNTPEVDDFAKGVVLEAAHQRARWAVDHDAGKSPFDWFWLIGYLAQKAASSAVAGNTEKALHHTISTAAALANWHLALSGADTRMRPGIGPGNGGDDPGSANQLAQAATDHA